MAAEGRGSVACAVRGDAAVAEFDCEFCSACNIGGEAQHLPGIIPHDGITARQNALVAKRPQQLALALGDPAAHGYRYS